MEKYLLSFVDSSIIDEYDKAIAEKITAKLIKGTEPKSLTVNEINWLKNNTIGTTFYKKVLKYYRPFITT